MSYNKPVVVIDFANNRIRIHKKTIRSIGSPEYIALLINPEKLTLGIVGCSEKMRDSHRIEFKKAQCYELYSKSLVEKIKTTFPYWDINKSYRLTGDYVERNRMAQFILSESVPIKTDKVNM